MLTPEEAAEFDVKIVPLSITIDGTSYQDGCDAISCRIYG